MTEDWLKSEYTILLAGYFTWPDEEAIDTFRLGVLASEEVFTQLSLKSGVQTLKNKPFRVVHFRNLSRVGPVEVLYVGESKNNSLRRIHKRFGDKSVLMVSDSAKDSEFTMINLLAMNRARGKPFVLNKTNIDNAGLKVSPKILFIGGDEDDLRDIYRELQEEGNRMRADLDTLSLELYRKQSELYVSERKLEQRSGEIETLVREIELQTAQLTTLSDSVDLAQMGLRGPSSTWTYLVNDDPFTDRLAATLMSRRHIGFAAYAGCSAPLLLLWMLSRRWQRRGGR